LYKATVIEVFIASPGDVVQERQLIREVIDEWNIIHSKKRLTVIKDLGWEYDVYSSFKEGRAQEAINKQILEYSDLLIGVFWTKVGTPTGDYVSGSIEEITCHINANKPAMLFFSNSPVHPDSVDQSQYQKLSEFKKMCQGRGLYNPYDSIEKFVEIFRRQLGLLMNNEKKILMLIGASEDQNDTPHENVPTKIPLSDKAMVLLKEMSLDPQGELLNLMVLSGQILQTNGKNLVSEDGDPRDQANLNAAIEELEKFDLIRANNFKRVIFTITAKGYEIADLIKNA